MIDARILLIVSYIQNAIMSDILDENPHWEDVIDHLEAVKLLAIGE